MITTIQLDKKTKKKLDSLKVHNRESYNELILRLIESCPVSTNRENLIETIEVLSDPETMRNIAETLENMQRGEFGISWEEIKRERNLNV